MSRKESSWKILRVGLLILLICLVGCSLAGAEDIQVEKIEVKITSEVPLPPLVAKRMEASIATVGEHVLLGKRAELVKEKAQGYQKLIKDVFERVLVGYTVEQVNVYPGRTAQVEVILTPWGDVVGEAAVEFDLGGISPEAAVPVKKELDLIRGRLMEILVGMPIDAVDWAGGVSKALVRDLVAENLPDFRANVDIASGTKTIVRVTLMPQGAVVRSAAVSTRSHTMPNLLLGEITPGVEKKARVMYGLPVGFVERNRQYFSELLRQEALKQAATKRYGLTLEVDIEPGGNTDVVVKANTENYRFFVEGYMDMGRKEDSTSFKLHAGKVWNRTDELFLEMKFVTGSVTWEFEPGWGHHLGRKTSLGVRYNTNHDQTILWCRQGLGERWNLRLERIPASNYNEIGIRYKIHDFLSAEYIFTRDEKWLRLVGHL